MKASIDRLVSPRNAALAMPMVFIATGVPVARAQSAAAPVPRWEAISIRPTPEPVDEAHCVGNGASPGRLTIPCNTLAALIDTAFFLFADGHRKQAAPPARFDPVSGGPAWLRTDHWQINAKAEGAPGQEMMRGPMLQALLEERFKLKVHRETREVPVYALTVGKGGIKLQPFKGSCAPADPARPPEPGRTYCRSPLPERRGSNMTMGFVATSVDQFAKTLNGMLDRPSSTRPVLPDCSTSVWTLRPMRLRLEWRARPRMIPPPDSPSLRRYRNLA